VTEGSLQGTRQGWYSARMKRHLDIAIAMVICLNAGSLGYQANWSLTHPSTDDMPLWIVVAEWAFVIIFTVEISMRLVSEGAYFINPNNKLFLWNVFDTGVVLSAIFETFFSFHLNLSAARVCRVLRLARVLRFVRLLRSFRELRVMVAGIMNCGKTMLWSFLILTIVTYSYAIFLIQLCTEWRSRLETSASSAADAELLRTEQFLHQHFRSLPWSMYTLSKSLLGGLEWGLISDPLCDLHFAVALSFTAYIGVTALVVLNIITATFVQAAARSAGDQDSKFLDYMEDKKEWLNKVSAAFQGYEKTDVNSLNWCEFRGIMDSLDIQVLFSDIGLEIDYQHQKDLFKLFDVDGDGRIDIHEFVQGISVYRGAARSVDMFKQFQSLSRKLDAIMVITDKDYYTTRPTEAHAAPVAPERHAEPEGLVAHAAPVSASERVSYASMSSA
jgi:hypothetical protein